MSRRGWLLFVAMGFIWGIPYLLIKVAVDELSPASIVLARTALGALILLPIALFRNEIKPLLKHWKPLLAYTVIEICGPWLFMGFAEQRLSSSLTGLLVAATPLVAAVSMWATRQEHLGARRLAGLLVGIAGVAALVGLDLGAVSLPAILAMAGVALGYAFGPMILARHLSDLPSLGVVAGSLVIAAIVYLPFGIGQWPQGGVTVNGWLAVVGLAVICTATAFIVFFKLIAEVGPARASVITYFNPAVALLLGVLVLHENLTLAMGVGFVLILLGSVLATSREQRQAAEPENALPPEAHQPVPERP